jgi:hypothetical protein
VTLHDAVTIARAVAAGVTAMWTVPAMLREIHATLTAPKED